MTKNNSAISVVVVDDEPLARKFLCSLVEKDPDLRLVGSCSDGDEARREIPRLNPDLVFLDIQMPKFSGVEVAEALSRRGQMPYVVFVTAYDQYAVKAFEMEALDYLLKPLEPIRFRRTIQRVKKAMQQQRIGELSEQIARVSSAFGSRSPSGKQSQIVVRRGDELVDLRVQDIVWVEAASQYVHVHTVDHMYTLAKSLKRFQQELPDEIFTRVHRSALVNRNRLKRVLKRPNGIHRLELEDGTKVPVSRSRRKLVPELLRDCAGVASA